MKNVRDALNELKRDMKKNCLAPSQDIVIDNNRHIYQINIDGKDRQASYIASEKPVGNQGPLLICSYGLLDEEKQYFFRYN